MQNFSPISISIYQTMLERVTYQLEIVLHTHLLQYPGLIESRSSDTYVQLGRNLFERLAFSDPNEHLKLTG